MQAPQDGQGQVVIEMVEMDQPAFVPAAQHLGEMDRLLHRIAPQQPAGAMDGQQGPVLAVYPRIASRIPYYSPFTTWFMNLLSRGRGRDGRPRPYFSTRCRKCLIIFSVGAIVAGGVVFLAWYFSRTSSPRGKVSGKSLRPFHN